MSRKCDLTGRKTTVGRRLRTRGKAKYLGGVGTKITGKNKRKLCPNVHKVTALVDGRPQKIKASAKAMRSGLVVKPLKRRYARKVEGHPANQQAS